MDRTVIAVMQECADRSLADSMKFPEVVTKLVACGVESYHTDLYRREKTFYLPDGESHIVPMPIPTPIIAADFSAESVRDAIRASQQDAITYQEFMNQVAAAGTTQYFVYLRGRCAVYIGRDSSQHIEHFPKPA